MTDTAPTSSSAVEQIIQQRREKKERAQAAGKTPYGHRYQFSHTLAAVRETFDPVIVKEGENGLTESKETVNLVGRMMTRRDMGKLCFAHLQDLSGKLQIKVSKQSIGEELYKEFIKDLDLGDIVAVTGRMTRTKTGELSLSLEKFELLSKSLRPWPEKYHGVTDIETRSRQRELDLVMTAESRDRFLKRSKLIQSLRRTLDDKRFIEVETPLMQAVPGGAAAKPFITHHEALDLDMYMRIAPELYLKRLLVGGFERVYEIGRVFRNEGIDTRHNPEFTILETYQAYGNVEDMMDLAEELIMNGAKAIGVQSSTYRGETVDFTKKFARRSLIDLFKDYLNLDMVTLCKSGEWKKAAIDKGLDVPKGSTDRKCFDLLFDEVVLPKLNEPTFVLDYPSSFSPLAKTKPTEPLLADRFELFIAKEEVANAYTEQNDPDEQRRKFSDELKKRQSGDEEAMPVDEDFLLALEHGMPPAGGLGIGIDRITMVLTGCDSIREVILFPLLRPQS